MKKFFIFSLLLLPSILSASLSSAILEFHFPRNQVFVMKRNVDQASTFKAEDNKWGLSLRLTKAGQAKLKKLTKENMGKQMRVFSEGKLILSVPVGSEVTSNLIQLAPTLTQQEAEKIVAKINTPK